MDDNDGDAKSAINEVKSIECRTCLEIMHSDSELFNIFESWNLPWFGMQETVAADLMLLANVEICPSDIHSKVICNKCYQILHEACVFATIVRQNDQILQTRCQALQESDKVWPKPIQVEKSIHSAMQDNGMDVEVKQEVLSDNEYETPNGTYENGEDFANLDIKVEPEEMIQQQPSQQYTVNGNLSLDHLNSDMEHLTNGNSGEHLVAKIKDEPLSEEEDVEQMQSDLPLECLLCSKDFNSVTGLKAHVIAQHSYKSVKRKSNNSLSPERNKCNYVCAICRRNFTTSTDLMVHETCHNKSVCYGCNESFDSFEELTKHRQSCKAITSHEVKKLKTLDDVLRPLPIDPMIEPINRLKCSLCDETFTDMYYLTLHQEIQHSAPNQKTFMQEDGSFGVDALDRIFNDTRDA